MYILSPSSGTLETVLGGEQTETSSALSGFSRNMAVSLSQIHLRASRAKKLER